MPMSKKNDFSTENISSAANKTFSVGQPDDKKLIIQMTKIMWEQLRRLSFELNISMAELCREGIAFVLDKHKKTLDEK